MNIGMLWYDPDPKVDLTIKVHRAAAYYAKKYGRVPNMAFVNPSDAPVKQAVKAGEIEIRVTRSVLPNHIWIGIKQVRQ